MSWHDFVMQKEVLLSETKSLKTLQISIGFASRTYCSLLCAGTFWNVDDYWHQEVNNNIDKSHGPKLTPTKVFISQSNIAPNYLRCYNGKRPCILIQDDPEHLSGYEFLTTWPRWCPQTRNKANTNSQVCV
jgi:hypothetical protein